MPRRKKFENCDEFCDFAPIEMCDEVQRPMTKQESGKATAELNKIRYHTDPEYRKRVLAYHRKWENTKYAEDPVWRAKRLAQANNYHKKTRK